MVRIRELPNKPLVEAILEFRWKVSPEQGDPLYPLSIGRLYEKLQTSYPFPEALPSAMIPQPLASYVVQHRFRRTKAGWPLVQVGPGIITINDTEGYRWSDFGERVKAVLDALLQTYADPASLSPARLMLRYIDAVPLGSFSTNPLAFLNSMFKTRVDLPGILFSGTDVDAHPKTLALRIEFPTSRPKGHILLQFGTGLHRGQSALVWETTVYSENTEIPSNMEGLASWLEAAHTLTDDWFFKLIEGELERRFAGE